MIWAALTLGAIVGLGLVWLVAELTPRHPKLSAALDHLGTVEVAATTPTKREQMGRVMQHGLLARLQVNSKDLALVGISPAQHSSNQAMMGLLGFIIAPLLAGFCVLLLGLPAPLLIVSLPVSLGMALLLIWATNLTVTQKAEEARHEFARAVATYIELVAAERKRNTAAGLALRSESVV